MSGLRLVPSGCHNEGRDESVTRSASGMVQPIKHTSQPIVTGSSVVAMKCIDGVVIAADTLGSYGSLARFRDISRIYKATDECIIGVGGDISDYEQIVRYVEQETTRNFCYDDGHKLSSKSIYQYLARIMYNRRNKMDPLWNKVVIAGMDNDVPTLGLVDLVGTHFESNVIATGFGEHLGLPLLRKAYNDQITCEQAKLVITNIMKVLFYRDARTIDRVQIASVTKDGVDISDPFTLETKWDYKSFISGARIGDDSTW